MLQLVRNKEVGVRLENEMQKHPLSRQRAAYLYWTASEKWSIKGNYQMCCRPLHGMSASLNTSVSDDDKEEDNYYRYDHGTGEHICSKQ